MENQHYKSYEQAALDILRGKKPEEETPVQQEQQKQETPQPLSEEIHPDALHVKPVKVNGQTKYKVHAVGANHSDGIKVGEHLSDSELDDFSEMGGKIKHMKEQVKPEVEKSFPATGVKKNPPMKGVSTMPKDKERRGPMPAGAMKEEAEELDEISQELATKAYAKRSSTMTHDDPVARKKEDKAWERIGKRWGQKGQQKADAAADKYQAEEIEELDEMGPGKLPRIDKKVENEYSDKLMADFKARGGQVQQVKSPALPKNRNRMVARGSLSSGERTVTRSGGKSYTSRMEEVEEDYDQLIEEKNAFEIELPEQLTFADYLNAAKIFTESYDDAIVVADHFFRKEDESLIVEAFTRSDIEDRVKMHQKAGNQATMPKYGMKNGKPYAEYTITDKESGRKTKYIHHGDTRRVERMN